MGKSRQLLKKLRRQSRLPARTLTDKVDYAMSIIGKNFFYFSASLSSTSYSSAAVFPGRMHIPPILPVMVL